MDLKAFCLGAKKVLDKIKDLTDSESAGPIVKLIEVFGTATGEDLITDYAQVSLCLTLTLTLTISLTLTLILTLTPSL